MEAVVTAYAGHDERLNERSGNQMEEDLSHRFPNFLATAPSSSVIFSQHPQIKRMPPN